MSRHKLISVIFLWFSVQIVCGDLILNDLSFRKDDCEEVCSDSGFIMSTVKDANSICQRGCRIFTLIDARGDSNVNKTRLMCHTSCKEAYFEEPKCETCKFGCNEMQKRKENDISNGFVVYFEENGQNNIMIVQPELEQIDLDILADPGLRGQIDFGYSVEYKIPETHIRTMPFSERLDNYGIPPDMTLKQSYQPSGDWLDCASRNSGIPRWMLISAILLAVLLGIWLIFASEKREPMPTQTELLISDTETLINHLEFPAPPPKYSLESEKV